MSDAPEDDVPVRQTGQLVLSIQEIGMMLRARGLLTRTFDANDERLITEHLRRFFELGQESQLSAIAVFKRQVADLEERVRKLALECRDTTRENNVLKRRLKKLEKANKK